MPIFHAVRLYRPDGSNVDNFRRRSVEEGLRILMPGTMGAELIPEAAPAGEARLDTGALLAGGFQRLGRQRRGERREQFGGVGTLDGNGSGGLGQVLESHVVRDDVAVEV